MPSNKKKEVEQSKTPEKILGGAEKENEQVQTEIVKSELINNNTNLDNIRKATTLSSITKEDGKIYAKTAPGQNRNLDTDGLVSVDEEWLPKLLNLEGAGEKYKNIGENELKFILNIV